MQSQPGHNIADVDVDRISLVETPANGQNFLGIKKDAPDPDSCPIGRAIQHLSQMMGADGDDPEHQHLVQVLEQLRSLDADHCAEGDSGAAETVTPGMVRESLEAVILTDPDRLYEALQPALDIAKDHDSIDIEASGSQNGGRRLQESARFLTSVDDAGWQWDVCIIESGDSKNGSWDGGTFIPRHYPLKTLQEAAKLFDGARVYVYEFKDDRSAKTRYDHLTENALKANPNGYAKNLVGWITRPRIDGNSLIGTVRLLKGADWLRVNLQDSVKYGKPDLYGLSIDSDGSQHLGRVGGQPRLVVDALHDVRSVDVVTYPAAGGRFLRLVASRPIREIPTMGNELEQKVARLEAQNTLRAILQESRLPALEAVKIHRNFKESVNDGKLDIDALEGAIKAARTRVHEAAMANPAMASAMHAKPEVAPPDPAVPAEPDEAAGVGFTGVKEVNGRKVYFKNGKVVSMPAQESQRRQADWLDQRMAKMAQALDQKMAAFEHKQKLVESQEYLMTAVSTSGLPEVAQADLLRRLKGRLVEAAVVDREIEATRAIVASVDTSGDLRVGGQHRDVRVTESEWDKRTTALDGFWANEDLKTKDGNKVRRVRSLQEAYEVMTGKRYSHRTFMRESLGLPGEMYDSSGRYGVQAGRMTEALSTSSWAQILGDSITRRMLAEYNVPSLQAWRQIVSEIGNIKDFRTQRRMRIGGYGLLPTVGQGDSYAPLTSPTDEEATYAISKKGGTETVTLEMMANDDVGAMRRIPLRLGRAAAQTLYRTVFDLIKDNTAVSFTDDSQALFHSSHSNIGSTALNPDSLEAALIRMKRQAAYNNSTEPLGLQPKFLLHPPDLWRTVKKLLLSEGEAFINDNDMNPFKELKLEPIEIYYWTDTNNWYLCANPNDIPTIEVGFFEGAEDPEIFVSDQENISNSSMFAADKVTYKIRHIYGVGVLEYRGFDGSLVS